MLNYIILMLCNKQTVMWSGHSLDVFLVYTILYSFSSILLYSFLFLDNLEIVCLFIVVIESIPLGITISRMFSKFINLEFAQCKVNPLTLQVSLSDKVLYAYALGPEETKVVI